MLANQPVSFQLYTSTSRSGETPGALLVAPRAELASLPPIRTVLRHGRKLAARTIPVHVEAKRTALGTLELWCAAKESEHRWRLEFQLRDAPPLLANEEEIAAPSGAELTVTPEQRDAAVAAIAAVFPPKDAGPSAAGADPAGLPRALETALGAGKDAWSLGVLRALWDALWAGAARRTLTAAHEARWLNLCGFLLRPGFGHEMDAWRVKQLGGPLAAGLAFPRAVQNRAEWWNLWKRVAGGLERGPQLRLHGEVAPWIVPRLAKKTKVKVAGSARPGTQEIREMWQAIGACERIDARLKQELGDVAIDDVVRGKAAAATALGPRPARRARAALRAAQLRRRGGRRSQAGSSACSRSRSGRSPSCWRSPSCRSRASSTTASATSTSHCAIGSRLVWRSFPAVGGVRCCSTRPSRSTARRRAASSTSRCPWACGCGNRPGCGFPSAPPHEGVAGSRDRDSIRSAAVLTTTWLTATRRPCRLGSPGLPCRRHPRPGGSMKRPGVSFAPAGVLPADAASRSRQLLKDPSWARAGSRALSLRRRSPFPRPW